METDTLNFMQGAYDIFNVIADVAGDFVILKGCEINGTNVTDGIVAINGEVLFFRGGTSGANVLIRQEVTSKPFEDGALKEVYFNRYATFGTGVGSLLWSSFVRVTTNKQLQASLNTKATNESLQAVAGRVERLERVSAPNFGRGRIWWTGTLRQLEEECPGWAEDVDWREYFPFHYNPNRAPYNVIGATGGLEAVTLTVGQLPRHHVKLFANETATAIVDSNITANTSVRKSTTSSGSRDEKYALIAGTTPATLGTSSEVGNNEPHNNMPPYRLGMWIRYVG